MFCVIRIFRYITKHDTIIFVWIIPPSHALYVEEVAAEFKPKVEEVQEDVSAEVTVISAPEAPTPVEVEQEGVWHYTF